MEKKYFVGIDVSKLTMDVSALNGNDPKKIEYRRFSNTEQGFADMEKWIQKLTKASKSELLFCMENTGVYSLLFSKLFFLKNYFVWVENAVQIKKSIGIKRGKTDKVDSAVIAGYCHRYKDIAVQYQPASETLLAIQELESARQRHVKIRSMIKAADSERIKDGIRSDYIHKINQSEIAHQDAKIKEIETEISLLIQTDLSLKKNYDLALSVKGVGPQIALFMLIHTKGFTCFKTSRQFACYSGVAPFEHSSGTSVRGGTRVSNMANKKIKSLLHMGALSAVRFDPEIETFYERKKDENKHELSILNMVKKKLIERVFAVVKRGTPYMNAEQYRAYRKAA